ncbi:class I SAM-dependent methyltransferase [Rickettsia endosymbiont of Halotydeus destructor]|uniref:class I SAM-dependent methyltransferase n=1 Tax=Rickettsia endosymbiont of Halotydeus destructor TaxID=2996754 RepID=UPI003BAF6ADD
MTFIDYRHQATLYAQAYSKLEITGTQYLAFRDIPNIIKNYVKGNKVLDYGCGVGKSTTFLKSLELDVEGVDINEEMLRIANLNDPKGIYKLIKSGNIPAENNTYDLVFSSWVMMEVESKEELVNISKEIARVLKNGGIFIMLVCNENTYNRDWLSENTEFPENQNLTSGSTVRMFFKNIDLSIYDYFWTKEDYKYMLDQADLKIINIHQPLGTDQDGYPWVNEKTISPVSIYVASKN